MSRQHVAERRVERHEHRIAVSQVERVLWRRGRRLSSGSEEVRDSRVLMVVDRHVQGGVLLLSVAGGIFRVVRVDAAMGMGDVGVGVGMKSLLRRRRIR
jgi:hypothetical protein